MGFFGRRKSKTAEINKQDKLEESSSNEQSNPPLAHMPSPPKISKKIANSNVEPTLQHVPQLIHDIKMNESGDKPARALRQLFALSELPSDNRTEMVAETDLVPTLLTFLQRTERGSSEQYLTLLVLNNISIPAQNKRIIAVDHAGAGILAKLLCDDPSCHLLAIILVNLSFCDAQLRNDLADLIPSMAYALALSTLTPSDFETYDEVGDTVESKLASLLEREQTLRPALSDVECHPNVQGPETSLFPENHVYPESARWCLAALKNLTRPPSTPGAQKLLESGIVPLIMRIISIGGPVSPAKLTSDGSSPATEPNENVDSGDSLHTTAWDSNSIQDTALFVVLNLAAVLPEEMTQLDGVHVLSLIADYSGTGCETLEQTSQMQFQSIKARIALSYLVGSSGHFGQLRGKNTTATYTHSEDSVILVSCTDACFIVDMLANTLHNRALEGPGGYSAATFHVKWVLYGIRCLLTHATNQMRFLSACGARLNALLMKALAEHSMKQSTVVDAEAAEYASFSLYLQSNYGFVSRFLPAVYGNDDKIKGTGSLAAKVLTSYIHMESITPAGRHAADQLLLRLRYMQFKGSVAELATGPMTEGDYSFDDELLKSAESIVVEKRSHGARPSEGIFDRPILRSRAPKKGSRAPWENRTVRIFPSALFAVQELSFGSSRVRHMDAIDDIMIANNIVNSANGDKTESYNYWWSWQDAAGEIQRNLERMRSTDSATNSLFSGAGSRRNVTSNNGADSGGPMSIFGLTCCAVDHTLAH